ncbi:hypothetical protein MAHJHV57_49980 [Mycobacterium avium subsp. hominissuis]
MTIDVWMQHPTVRFLRSEASMSLRRWTGGSIPDTDIPIEATLASLDTRSCPLGPRQALSSP